MLHNFRKNLFITLIFFCFLNPSKAIGESPIRPFKFPYGTIGSQNPPFIWQDLFNDRDERYGAKYRLTVRQKNKSSKFSTELVPKKHLTTIYILNPSFTLLPGKYEYIIERVVDNKSVNSRYFYTSNYPICGEFEINPQKKQKFEYLTNEKLVDYLLFERKNKLENGYNALFFGVSSTVTLAVGIAMHQYTNFGFITNLITTVCILSSVIGYGATTFYGYNYYQGKIELERMLVGIDNAFLKDFLRDERICVFFGFSF